MTMDDRQVALAAFSGWAARQPHAVRGADALVEKVDVSFEHAGFMTSSIEGRRVVWRSVPANARLRVSVPKVYPQTVDPWTVTPMRLRDDSDHVSICDACGGEKKVTCAACRGHGAMSCSSCGGSGKYYGVTANGARRMLNCQTCRGKGQLDCGHCRRGIAACSTCGGEGRLQQWLELETWHRTVATSHPPSFARRFGWSDDPPREVMARDVDVLSDVRRDGALTPQSIAPVPPEWLGLLTPRLEAGERFASQHLRVARLPVYKIRYRLGSSTDDISFTGRRLVAPETAPPLFARRASALTLLRTLLIGMGVVGGLMLLFHSVSFAAMLTTAALAAFAAFLAGAYLTAADWGGTRQKTRQWLAATGVAFVVALILMFAAQPRRAHAAELIANGDLARAEKELRALGGDAGDALWSDFRVAQIAGAPDVQTARAALEAIPPAAPQRHKAVQAFDSLLIQDALNFARRRQWQTGAVSLNDVSSGARGTSRAVVAAREVYLPLARVRIVGEDWTSAAGAISGARRLGVADDDLAPLVASLRAAATTGIREAAAESDAARRLQLRLAAERALAAWEAATGQWGTPELIALRGAMARDVALVERAQRRRR